MNTLLAVQNDSGSITDALYQDGNLYILYKEGLPFSDSFGSELYSRGAVIRYNLLTKSFDSTGFTTSIIAKDSGFKMTPVGAIYGINYPLYTNTGLTERFLPETDEAGIDVSTKYPDIFRPEDAEKAFYGPTRFIAIKPKKLVIADEGFAFYTGDDGLLRYKNVNRVVYVDLEDFVVSETKNINSNLSLSQDDTNVVLHGSGSDSISINAETIYHTSAGTY